MYRLVLPPITGLTKTIKPRRHSHAINAKGEIVTSITGNFMQTILTGQAKLTEAEFSQANEVVHKAGHTPVFMSDPLDNSANAYREYDGYGGWTQGVYIPSYNQYSGFIAKLYGLTCPLGADGEQLVYIRPIAYPFNLSVQSTPTIHKPALCDPITQLVSIGILPSSVNIPDFVEGYGVFIYTLPELTLRMYPATFNFEQAYRITKFDTNLNGSSGLMLNGCGGKREIQFEAQEVYWNTRACWMRVLNEEQARVGEGQPN